MKRLLLVTAGLVTSVVGLNQALCLVSQAAPPANRATPAHIDQVPPSIILSSKPVDWRTPVVDLPPVAVRLKQASPTVPPAAPQPAEMTPAVAPAAPVVESSTAVTHAAPVTPSVPVATATTLTSPAPGAEEHAEPPTAAAAAADLPFTPPASDAPSRLGHSPESRTAADAELQVDKLAATKSKIAQGAVRRAIEGTQQHPSTTIADDLPQQRLYASSTAHRGGSGGSGGSFSSSSVPSYPAAARAASPAPATHSGHAAASYRPRASNWGATRADRAKVGPEAMRWDPLATPHSSAQPNHSAHPASPSIPERPPTGSSATPRPMRTASYVGPHSPAALQASLQTSFSPTTRLAIPTSAYPSQRPTEASGMQARVEQHRAAAASIIQQTRPTASPLVARPPIHDESSASPPGRMLDKRPPLVIPQPSPRRVAKSLSD